MTKVKKIVAAAVAAATVGALGVTAFAGTNYTHDFYFSLEGRDDLYFDISDGVRNEDWGHPAQVTIESSNLNATNRAFLSVTGDASWPENYVLSEEKRVDGNISTTLIYSGDYIVPLTVYLLATTGDDVEFSGTWEP